MMPLYRKAGLGRGVRREPGQMNGWEKKYAAHLELLRSAGEVLWWSFDAVKLRLADKTFYTPDFLVMLKDFSIEVHEVKGHWEDDARVKIKVAAEKFPFLFKALKPSGGQWAVEEF
jgi:hypothetical protein